MSGGPRLAQAFEAVPNFSEGRDQALVGELASDPHVIDVHSDADHNRAVLTLAGVDLNGLSSALFGMVALATERIDLRRHSGLHPRVGAADVVPIVPLGTGDMSDAVAASVALGERIWIGLGVPVYYYGETTSGRKLSDIRTGSVKPDLGLAHHPHPTAGAVCVGARRPLVAFNVAFNGLSLIDGRRIATRLRDQAGVQALAFPLSDRRTQVSMNLTRPDQTPVREAYSRACELAQQSGEPELVGLCPAAAAGPGCDAKLLEARLVSCAASKAAASARLRGGDEMARLADRLEGESRSIRAIPYRQEEVLAGAERAAALVRLLRGAGLADHDLEALLAVAASGLRAAVSPLTASRFSRRVALLDSWLDSPD